MDERRQGFLRAGVDRHDRPAGHRQAWRSQRAARDVAALSAGPWQPSDEIDPRPRRGGRSPPRRSSSHVVRDDSFARPIDRK